MTRQRTQIIRRVRSNKGWSALVDVGNAVSAASTKVLIGSLTPSNPGIDETVLRTVGVLGLFTDQVAADEDQQGAFGMIVVSNDAIAAGAASIPGPISDAGHDGWFAHVPFLERFSVASVSGFNFDMSRTVRFDFKSKRRVETGYSIALMVESTAASEGFTIGVNGRLLSMVSGT